MTFQKGIHTSGISQSALPRISVGLLENRYDTWFTFIWTVILSLPVSPMPFSAFFVHGLSVVLFSPAGKKKSAFVVNKNKVICFKNLSLKQIMYFLFGYIYLLSFSCIISLLFRLVSRTHHTGPSTSVSLSLLGTAQFKPSLCPIPSFLPFLCV